MIDETAFVGDVHANLDALLGMRALLAARGCLHLVFLGDYVNKGSRSAEVVEELLDIRRSGRATFLRGNHETALLEALDTGELTTFIKMGGAATIRSYVGGPVGPDVAVEFRSRFPDEHRELLRSMPEVYESDEVVARHIPDRALRGRFSVSAHSPVGELPLIGARSAQLDTGCGTPGGRLTALLWPSREYVQVDAVGHVAADGTAPRDHSSS